MGNNMHFRGDIVPSETGQTEKDEITQDLTYIWNKNKHTQHTKLLDIDNRLVAAEVVCERWWKWWREQKIQISSYKGSKLWGCNVQHGDYS